MVQTLRCARSAQLAMCLACGACSPAPSRTPLGGIYDTPPVANTASNDRRAPESARPPLATPASDSEPEPAPAKVAAEVAPVATDTKAADSTLVYQPLKAGDRIDAEVSVGFDSERSGPLASGKFGMTGKERVELKIGKASARSLDELELTVTTLSMHVVFGGQAQDEKPEPPEVYDVTLGQSPSVRARSGSKPDAAERAMLLMLVTPIADFHAHWGHAPAFDLKPGWSSKVPVTLPAFADGHSESVKVGPFGVGYAGRDNDSVHFDVTLPVQYGADMGTLDFDLKGQATLSAKNGRPTSFDMRGPFTAQIREGGGSHADPALSGTTKFSATLSYH